jgi:hypothetical protein
MAWGEASGEGFTDKTESGARRGRVEDIANLREIGLRGSVKKASNPARIM